MDNLASEIYRFLTSQEINSATINLFPPRSLFNISYFYWLSIIAGLSTIWIWITYRKRITLILSLCFGFVVCGMFIHMIDVGDRIQMIYPKPSKVLRHPEQRTRHFEAILKRMGPLIGNRKWTIEDVTRYWKLIAKLILSDHPIASIESAELIITPYIKKRIVLYSEPGLYLVTSDRYLDNLFTAKKYSQLKKEIERGQQVVTNNNYGIHKYQAKLHVALGDWKQAYAASKTLIGIDRQRAFRDLIEIANPFWSSNKLSLAGISFYQALAQDLPTEWWVYENMATLAQRVGMEDLANQAFAQSKKLR